MERMIDRQPSLARRFWFAGRLELGMRLLAVTDRPAPSPAAKAAGEGVRIDGDEELAAADRLAVIGHEGPIRGSRLAPASAAHITSTIRPWPKPLCPLRRHRAVETRAVSVAACRRHRASSPAGSRASGSPPAITDVARHRRRGLVDQEAIFPPCRAPRRTGVGADHRLLAADRRDRRRRLVKPNASRPCSRDSPCDSRASRHCRNCAPPCPRCRSSSRPGSACAKLRRCRWQSRAWRRPEGDRRQLLHARLGAAVDFAALHCSQ